MLCHGDGRKQWRGSLSAATCAFPWPRGIVGRVWPALARARDREETVADGRGNNRSCGAEEENVLCRKLWSLRTLCCPCPAEPRFSTEQVGLIVVPDPEAIASHDASVHGHLGFDLWEGGRVRDRAVVVPGEKLKHVRAKCSPWPGFSTGGPDMSEARRSLQGT